MPLAAAGAISGATEGPYQIKFAPQKEKKIALLDFTRLLDGGGRNRAIIRKLMKQKFIFKYVIKFLARNFLNRFLSL